MGRRHWRNHLVDLADGGKRYLRLAPIKREGHHPAEGRGSRMIERTLAFAALSGLLCNSASCALGEKGESRLPGSFGQLWRGQSADAAGVHAE